MRWLAVALVLGGAAAHAELDTFKTGNGHHGALVIPAGQTIGINPSAPLAMSAPSGSTQLQLVSAPFVAGDVLLLINVKGLAFVPDAGVGAPLPLDAEELGRHELVRIASVAGTTVTLTQPLVASFRANAALAVHLPEYTSVTIAGTLVSSTWAGAAGGVVGFFATDVVNLTGSVNANGTGFRGGPTYLGADVYGLACRPVAQDRPTDGGLLGTGPKAEGAAVTNFPFVHGGGNVANAGGGGMCHEAGGGGGAHLGPGGRGGLDQNDTPAGGSGGAPFVYVPGTRLLFGGGGGAGEYHHTTDTPAGGAGGGIVFVRARAFVGTGTFSADGRGPAGTFVDNGAGGGGAGGSILVRVFGDGGVDLLRFSARGGNGGNVPVINGPGGGGGGGAIRVQGGVPGFVDVSAGLGGGLRLPDGGLQDRAATPSAATAAAFAGKGFVTAAPPDPVPAPVLTAPAGLTLTGPRPMFAGASVPDAGVFVFVDGLLVAQTVAAANAQFSAPAVMDLPRGTHRARAQAVVDGLASDRGNEVQFAVDSFDPAPLTLTSPLDGEVLTSAFVTYRGEATPLSMVTVRVDGTNVGAGTATGGLFAISPPTPLRNGPHVAVAVGEDGGTSTPVTFSVDADGGTVGPSDGGTDGPRTYGVGCGCSEAPGAFVLVVLLGLRRRQRFDSRAIRAAH